MATEDEIKTEFPGVVGGNDSSHNEDEGEEAESSRSPTTKAASASARSSKKKAGKKTLNKKSTAVNPVKRPEVDELESHPFYDSTRSATSRDDFT